MQSPVLYYSSGCNVFRCVGICSRFFFTLIIQVKCFCPGNCNGLKVVNASKRDLQNLEIEIRTAAIPVLYFYIRFIYSTKPKSQRSSGLVCKF